MNTNKIKHIGVFTSGGDSPGMNAALYAIAKSAEVNDIKVSGFLKGYEGLIDGDLIPLKSHELKKNYPKRWHYSKNSTKQTISGIRGS